MCPNQIQRDLTVYLAAGATASNFEIMRVDLAHNLYCSTLGLNNPLGQTYNNGPELLRDKAIRILPPIGMQYDG